MKNKNITIEQTLHGYSQGHHLLAASMELSTASQRTMSILSDLSGPEIYEGFSEYLTGYPLVEDNYYALARTWYASEMDRPGCAWTHTLLIKFDDFLEIEDNTVLLKFFDRPQKDFNKDDYSKSLTLSQMISQSKNIYSNNVDKNELAHLMWSIYNNNKPIILPSSSSEKYEKLILEIWEDQWSMLRKNFSFCTGSLANRKLGKQTFDVQVVPYALSKSVGRSDSDSLILENNEVNSLDSPKWVSDLVNETLYGANERFKEFLEDFGRKFKTREYFAKLSRLYMDTNAKDHIKSIEQYLMAADIIFKKSDQDLVLEDLIDQLLNKFPNKWFAYNDFLSFLEDLSTSKSLNGFSFEKIQLTSQLELLWVSDKDKAKKLFKGLISKELNQLGEMLLREYSQLIKPDQLPVLTDMDLGACNVLVSLNSKFALCFEIWKQPRNFQREIINCIEKSSLTDDLKEKIIWIILENSSEDLYEQVFNAFGKNSINIFLDWCRNTINQREEKNIKSWMNICTYDPETCIKWILSNENIDTKLLVSIISIFDPYSEVIRKHGVDPWIKAFKHSNYRTLDFSSRLTLAKFFLPLILMSNETISKDFVEFSFYPIYKALEENQFDYEQWIRLESLLPPVPWYNAWDKCKRLKQAVEQKI